VRARRVALAGGRARGAAMARAREGRGNDPSLV
jgi:hypothetical protein